MKKHISIVLASLALVGTAHAYDGVLTFEGSLACSGTPPMR